jgi:hypothetical protein
MRNTPKPNQCSMGGIIWLLGSSIVKLLREHRLIWRSVQCSNANCDRLVVLKFKFDMTNTRVGKKEEHNKETIGDFLVRYPLTTFATSRHRFVQSCIELLAVNAYKISPLKQ